MSRVGDVESHTAVDPGSLDRDECDSVWSESCWGETEDIDEDEDVEWGTLPPSMSHGVPVSQGEELGPTPSVLCQTATDERFGHMHTMIDSDEELFVRGTVIDSGHSSVLLPDPESQAALGSFGAGFSRQHTARRSRCSQGCTNAVR